jgi:hypothetical protein
VVKDASQIVDSVTSDQGEIYGNISDAIDIITAVTGGRVVLKPLRIGVFFNEVSPSFT